MSPAAAQPAPTILGKSTLVPIGLVISLLSVAFWVGSLQARVSQQEDRVDRISTRFMNRIDGQSEQLTKISTQTASIEAKLDLFMSIYRERAISPHK